MCNFGRPQPRPCRTCRHFAPVEQWQGWGLCTKRTIPDKDGHGNPRPYQPPMPQHYSDCHLHETE